MTETEKMEKHITSIRRLGEVLHKSIGSDYHAISLQLGGEFEKNDSGFHHRGASTATGLQ
ncbi:MAG TPA: hypothetical protein VHM93_05995 [Candidatus Acidoferrum sp.]|jgi:hypothetical protein|nr:hypothetical protein [Candidatus Acidoferrum sp.]